MKETYTVYGREKCSYCIKLKAFLDDSDISYRYIDLDEDEGALEFIRGKGLRTLPQVFTSDDVNIGGYTETVKFLQNRF